MAFVVPNVSNSGVNYTVGLIPPRLNVADEFKVGVRTARRGDGATFIRRPHCKRRLCRDLLVARPRTLLRHPPKLIMFDDFNLKTNDVQRHHALLAAQTRAGVLFQRRTAFRQSGRTT